MDEIYSCKNDKLKINEQYKELWKLLRYEGKYLPAPKQSKYKQETRRYKGKIGQNGFCYFDNIGPEIKLDYNYDHQVYWKANLDNITVGFYSPCLNLGPNLYLNVDSENNLTTYKNNKGKIIINCHRLFIFLPDFNRKCHHYPQGKYQNIKEITIKLKISTITRNNCNKLKIFNTKSEGIFCHNYSKSKYKKVFKLIRAYYDKTSITFPIISNLSSLPPPTDYNTILAKSAYQNIYSVTTQLQPNVDRDGDYGIIIKRDPGTISSAKIVYQINISPNILTTPDIIVMATYYNGKGYVLHQVNGVDVLNTHSGPYPNDNNIIEGKLLLESAATDITLIVSNSLYGLLPVDGQDPDTLIQFTDVKISYDSISR